MTSAIYTIGQLPMPGEPIMVFDDFPSAVEAINTLDDGFSERVREAQECIDSNVRGIGLLTHKERFGSKPIKKVKRKWRESSRKSVQGGGTI